MSSLDDLLNSALDELEVQEKESPPPPQPTKPTTTTTTTSTTTTSTTTTTTTSANINNNNSNNVNKQPDNFNLNDMMDMFKKVLGDDTIKQLNEGFEKGYNGGNDINENDLTEEDKKNIDEWAQKLSSAFNQDDLNQYFEKLSQQNDFDIKNVNNNGGNVEGVDINKFESNISDTLKNLADNASSNQPEIPGNMEEMLAELTKMFDVQNGEGEKFNDIFEESMEYMAKHYPEWIENNKDKYPAEEIDKFKKQSELFNMLVNSKETDTFDENLYSKMADLGNLPEAFCDEFLSKYESQIQKDASEQQEQEKK